jgi:DNA ligase (NAD+)
MYEDLVGLELFKDKKTQNLLDSIEKAKTVTLPRFLYALGIRFVGAETAEALANHFDLPTHNITLKSEQKRDQMSLFESEPVAGGKVGVSEIDDLISAVQALTPDKLNEIEGIGDKVGESIYEWFHDQKNIDYLEKLQHAGIKLFSLEGGKKSDKFAGLTFVITGTLPTLSRDKAKELVKQHGGKATSAVSKNTSFVLAGSEPGSKFETAEKLGVKIIGEAEFLKMIGS